MKIELSGLTICTALALASPANACSYPIREHPVFAPIPAESALQGRETVRLAIDEFLVPERLTKSTLTGWYLRWSAVRGEVLSNTEQLKPGQKIEVFGPFNGACFYPDNRYERDQQGRLIVWVTGTILHKDGAILLVPDNAPPSASDMNKGPLAWVKIRWGLNDR